MSIVVKTYIFFKVQKSKENVRSRVLKKNIRSVRQNQVKSCEANSLAEGNIYRQMTALSVPLIMGNILQQLYNTIDAVVIGRFAGADEFAAVGISGSIMNLFIFIIAGCCDGFGILFAIDNGAADAQRFRRQHFTAFIEGIIFTALLASLGAIFMNGIVSAVKTPEQLQVLVISYMNIIMLGLPAAFLYNFYAAMLRSVGDTCAALFILAAAAAANMALDIILVAEFGLGIKGAAAATVITQMFSAVVCAAYIAVRYKHFIFKKSDCVFEPYMMKVTARFGSISALHHSGLYIGKLFVQGAVNTAGQDAVAAYTAASRIEGFANSFGDSGAAAAAAITANSCGAKKPERAVQTFRCSFILLAVFGLLCSGIMYAVSQPAVSFMLGSGATVKALAEGTMYLKIISVFYVLCFTGNAYAGFFNGIGKVAVTFFGAVGHITVRVIISWLIIGRVGLSAAALATGAGWILVNIFWELLRRKFITVLVK